MRSVQALAAAVSVAAVAGLAAAQPVVVEAVQLVSPSVSGGDSFGTAVAMTDQIVAVGASGDDTGAQDVGALHFFAAPTYSFVRKVIAPTVEANQRFGLAVAAAGETVYAGAPFKEDDQGIQRGKVYAYSANGIGPIATFEPQPASFEDNNDLFGFAIAAKDGYVAVGAPGDDRNGNAAGVVYVYPGASQLVLAQPNDAAEFDFFGRSVAVDGELLVVGAPGDPFNGDSPGAVYIFEAETGNQILKISSPYGGQATARFGEFVDVRDNRILVGASFAFAGGVQSGQAFSYVYDPITQSVSLDMVATTPTPQTADRFGVSGAIGNTATVIGAPSNDPPGEAFVFSNGSISNSPFAEFRASSTSGVGLFGDAIDTDGENFVVGAPLSTGGGRAYVYGQALQILVQPRDFIAVSRDLIEIFLDIGAVSEPVTYVWRRDGIELTADDGIEGLNTPSISFLADQTRDGLYDCVISVGETRLTSEPAVVAVRNTCPADINDNRELNGSDFFAWIQAFGVGCEF